MPRPQPSLPWVALAPAVAAAALLSCSCLAGHPPRPVDLTRLTEKEAWAAIERAAPGDVFVVRDRRFEAGELQEQARRGRAAAEQRRHEAATSLASTAPFDSLRRQQELDRKRAAEKARARYEREIAAPGEPPAAVDPRVQELRLEAVRLLARLQSATREGRGPLQARWQVIEAELARLGAPLPADLPALSPKP